MRVDCVESEKQNKVSKVNYLRKDRGKAWAHARRKSVVRVGDREIRAQDGEIRVENGYMHVEGAYMRINTSAMDKKHFEGG